MNVPSRIRQMLGRGLLLSPPVSLKPPTYTLAMFAAEILRRVGTRLRAITALRKGSLVPAGGGGLKCRQFRWRRRSRIS